MAFNNSFQAKPTIKSTTNSDLIKAVRSDQYYEIGRAYQKNSHFNQAAIAYQKSLQLDPAFTKSVTGLATLYADQQLYVVSIPLFEQAVKLMPDAINYNNLGYAYYLNKEYAKASSALTQSVKLKPDYLQAKKNLELVSNHQSNIANNDGKDQPNTPLTLKPVNNESKPDKLMTAIHESPVHKQDSMNKVVVTNKIGTINKAVTTNAEATMIQTANGLYELSVKNPVVRIPVINIASNISLTKTVESNKPKEVLVAISGGITFNHMPALNKLISVTETALATFSVSDNNKIIEIVNGNGIKGMARSVASKFEVSNNVKTKVADAKRFNQMKTHIQYKSGYRNDAVKLNQHLLNSPYLIRNDNLPSNISLRLVLGKDLLPGFTHATTDGNYQSRSIASK